MVPHAASLSLNSRDTQWDLDSRLIPGIPAGWQIGYAISWVTGLLGFSQARWWWRFVTRTRTQPPAGLWRFAYECAYWLVFTPLVGPLAMLGVAFWSIVHQVRGFWHLLTWPFRRTAART